MATIDEVGRQAAADLRTEIERSTDVGAGLARLRDEAAVSATNGSRRLSGRVWIGLLTAAAAVATVAVVVTRHEPTRTIVGVPVGPSESVTTDPLVSDSSTTFPSTAASIAPTTSPEVETTTTAPLIASPGVTVSYTNPPPTFEPHPFASGQVAQAGSARVAVRKAGVVVVDTTTSVATLIDWTGTATSTVPLVDGVPFDVVVGPEDVLYGLLQGEGTTLEIVAIPLSGPSAGTVIARANVPIVTYTELPDGALGLGGSGIIDRVRDVGTQLIAYVDRHLNPLALEGMPQLTIDESNVVRMTGGPTWPLAIDRDPRWPGSYNGPTPPALSDDGSAVYWTTLGPPASAPGSGGDSEPTLPVIAALAADGTTQWWSLPDDWSVVSSDLWGTVLMRDADGTIELALFPDDDVRSAPQPPPAGTDTTNFDALGACATPTGETVPGPIPGSTLFVLDAVSITGPIIASVDVAPASNPAAIIGRVAISADGSTIAAIVDRRGADEALISHDRGLTWTPVDDAVVDGTSLALSPDGSILALVDSSRVLTLIDGDSTSPTIVALPPGTNAIGAMSFVVGPEPGGSAPQLAAALQVSDAPLSEFAEPSQIYLLDLSTIEWSHDADQPAATAPVFITSLVSTQNSIDYTAITAGADGSLASTTQVWRLGIDGTVALTDIGLSQSAILLGFDEGVEFIARHDDAFAYHILQRPLAGGDMSIDLGCLRPGSANDSNNDPDKQ